MAVESPFEILHLRDGGELVTRVARLEEGPVPVVPKDGRSPKVVRGIRLHVPPADKMTVPAWWDVTAQTLRPGLLELGPLAIASGRYLRIRKFGSAPSARFSLELLPAEFTGPAHADVAQATG